MTAATLLFVPPQADRPWRWWRVADDRVADEGEGLPDPSDEPVVAVAPADAVTLHWADLPSRSPAQAQAAARVLIGDASAGTGDLHVAVGPDIGGDRAIAVVGGGRMAGWLADMARAGIDPAAMIPAPLLLPEPEEGFVRADLAGQGIVRGRATGFADEARLTDLVTGGVAPVTLPRGEVVAAAAAALAARPLDLRQGAFARRRRRAIDWALVRRLAVLGGLVLLATLAIDLVRIARYSIGADTVEAQAAVIARQGLARNAGEGDAARMLGERLSRLRGPGMGFSATAAAVYAVVQTVPESDVTALAFQPDGALRVSLSLPGEAQANAMRVQLERAGLSVEPGTFQAAGGRVTGDLTVRP